MKTAEEIYSDLVQIFTERTGFAMDDSADLAVRLYAAAAEIESLYVYADWALAQSFPQTAAGDYLDRHGTLRGLTRQAAARATGVVRFSVASPLASDLTIPLGTVCLTTGLVRYATTAEASIPAGDSFVDVPAEAEDAGTGGNALAGTVVLMASPPVGVTACTNPAAFTGGTEEETDESFRARILASFARLPNGANRAFYVERALSHAGVAAAQVLPRVNGVGTVGVVIASTAGMPDDALVAEVQEDLEAAREIAVDVTVSPPEAVTVAVTAALTPVSGVSFDEAKTAVAGAVTDYFTGERLGKPVYRAVLGSLIYGTGLVENYDLTAPAQDVAASETALPILGELTLTEVG